MIAPPRVLVGALQAMTTLPGEPSTLVAVTLRGALGGYATLRGEAQALALVPAMLVAVTQKNRVPAATPVMVQVRSVVGAQV